MKLRKINRAAWAILAVTLVAMVLIQWQKEDVDLFGLIVGGLWYAVMCTGLGYICDQTIKEANE